MANLGPMELALILVVTLLLFGAGRIASVGKGFGQAIRQFKEGVRDDPEPKKPTGGS
jgi:sec-independent protein translocase protein TatA